MRWFFSPDYPGLPKVSRIVGLIVLVISLILVLAVIIYIARQSLDFGPAQPIPFSHRFHVSTKDINCMFCHGNALRSPVAGMPSEEKCLLCHDVIVSQFAPIRELREYRDERKPLEWVRVNKVPDFVHFSHEVHVAQGFDCGRCHGNVRDMDRILAVNEFDMNFCVTCHDNNGASVDCYTCHY